MKNKSRLLLLFLFLFLSVLVAEDQITFLFYADTREDPFANWSQKDHEKFVAKMVANENNVQHLVFGGDNVWLGFMDSSWNRFFEITDNFLKHNMKIYPAIGNHELILSRTLYAQMSREYPEATQGSRELNNFDTFITTLEQDLQQAEPSELCKQVSKMYWAVEHESRDVIYTMENPGTMSTSWDRFKKYVDAWPYLQEMVPQGKTYYSFLLPIGSSGLKTKIVIFDSNDTGNAAQQAWLKEELTYTAGPVVLVCHHPLFYPEKTWDAVPQLWLTGHHHDYERRSLDAAGTTGPVHMISGSGGAPTEDGKPHCNDDKTRVHKNWFNYSRITITTSSIRVTAFGCEKADQNLSQIDDFTFAWKK
jgi:hypothetical protein